MSGEPVLGVRGGATLEEVAAALTALACRAATDEPSRYEQWRSGRLAVLARSPRGSRAGWTTIRAIGRAPA